MKKNLNDYIRRVAPLCKGIGPRKGHIIALAVLTFKMGLYSDAVQKCREALSEDGSSKVPGFVKRALEILEARAKDLANGIIVSPSLPDFDSTDEELIPIRIPPEVVEDPMKLRVSNALLVLYTAAMASSPDDEAALEEQERYMLQLYAPYRKILEG